MKVKDLIARLQKLEDTDECEVFVITRHGVNMEPNVIGTQCGDVYVVALSLLGRCVFLDTYAVDATGAALARLSGVEQSPKE